MTESQLREQICTFARSLFERGLTPGSSGNVSVRLDDGVGSGGSEPKWQRLVPYGPGVLSVDHRPLVQAEAAEHRRARVRAHEQIVHEPYGLAAAVPEVSQVQ